MKGQLKVLESIDRLSHRRKQEREKDKILKAARSRSRAEDPEAAAKIKEQAKKVHIQCTVYTCVCSLCICRVGCHRES